ncbi:hypothetical protein GOODEAATRI_010122 [Goodea atripinnis]|uniref:Uncharacterized protein n=1 Tax=Goodea atripinnis TaxID=208336 RepID=A0ABV0N0E6_9TELE
MVSLSADSSWKRLHGWWFVNPIRSLEGVESVWETMRVRGREERRVCPGAGNILSDGMVPRTHRAQPSCSSSATCSPLYSFCHIYTWDTHHPYITDLLEFALRIWGLLPCFCPPVSLQSSTGPINCFPSSVRNRISYERVRETGAPLQMSTWGSDGLPLIMDPPPLEMSMEVGCSESLVAGQAWKLDLHLDLQGATNWLLGHGM